MNVSILHSVSFRLLACPHIRYILLRLQTTWSTFHKNVKIVEFHDYIWNLHEKCIQISTNMATVGLVSIWISLGNWYKYFGWWNHVPIRMHNVSFPMLVCPRIRYILAVGAIPNSVNVLTPFAALEKGIALANSHWICTGNIFNLQHHFSCNLLIKIANMWALYLEKNVWFESFG